MQTKCRQAQPAPFSLHFALVLHLMYIVLCQLLAHRDHSQIHKRGHVVITGPLCCPTLFRLLQAYAYILAKVEKEKKRGNRSACMSQIF